MARTPLPMIGEAAFWLVEPRGFEPLTSCLQIGLITRNNGPDLGERQSASDREYPLLTALNGPTMRPPQRDIPTMDSVVLPGSTT
ncbi:hypothetical protein Misp03_75990 [Microbispora sp. NBRC 16548]|nr:hypothetical protein Misp03_75990 [Microbispora sp. NBRC 16548]